MRGYSMMWDNGQYYRCKVLGTDAREAWKAYRTYQRTYASMINSVILIHGHYKAAKYSGEEGARWV